MDNSKILQDLLADQMKSISKDIRSGNSNLSQNQLEGLIHTMKLMANKDTLLNRYEAARFLNVSDRTFTNYIQRGWIPEGLHYNESKTLQWRVKDLEKFLEAGY